MSTQIRILVAEDSVTIQRAIEIAFAAEPAVVRLCSSWADTLRLAREDRPHVVLIDAQLEGRSGYDLAAALHSDPATAQVSSVLLTGNSSPYDADRGAAAHVDGYIAKPFETQGLIDKVAEVCRRKGLAGKVEESALPPVPVAPRPPAPVSTTRTIMGVAAIGGPPAPAPARPAPPPAPTRQTGQMAAIPTPPSEPPATLRPAIPANVPRMPREPLIPHIDMPAPRDEVTSRVPVSSLTPSAPAPVSSRSTLTGLPPIDTPRSPAADNVKPLRPPAPVSTVGEFEDEPTQTAPSEELVDNARAAAPARPSVPAPAPSPSATVSAEAAAALKGLSREVIEQIAWEVVPELAETIIREQLDRLVRDRRS